MHKESATNYYPLKYILFFRKPIICTIIKPK